MEDYHTHYLGESKNGNLFWGYITFAYPGTIYTLKGKDSPQFRKDYAILHLFDRKGNYLSTRSLCGGVAGQYDGGLLNKTLEGWVDELKPVKYCGIKIKLFETTIDGIVFGLIPEYESGVINLEPHATISFQEPWDGSYYT